MDKIFVKGTNNKGVLPKANQELLKFNHKELSITTEKWAKDLNRHFTTETKHIAETQKKEHMKRYFTSYAIREMETKIAMRYHYMPNRMANIQHTNTGKCWRGCGAT